MAKVRPQAVQVQPGTQPNDAVVLVGVSEPSRLEAEGLPHLKTAVFGTPTAEVARHFGLTSEAGVLAFMQRYAADQFDGELDSVAGAWTTDRRDTINMYADFARGVVPLVGPPGKPATFELGTSEQVATFVKTLGLPSEQSTEVTNALMAAEPGIRDALARLAWVWAGAERGGVMPSRLVLSGENKDEGIFGEGHGTLRWTDLARLAAAMPKAAGGVEDILIQACNSGYELMLEGLRESFPNVKTMVGYGDRAPGGASGAKVHELIWERETRGRSEAIHRQAFSGTRMGDHVVVWTANRPYEGIPQHDDLSTAETVATLRTSGQELLAPYLTGQAEVDDPAEGPVREIYQTLQVILHRRDLAMAERPELESMKEKALRLLFYRKVVRHFSEVHGATVRAGLEAVGVAPVEFTKLSRKDALSTIASFEAKLSLADPAPAAAARLAPLLRGLADLSPSVLLDTWV